MPQDDVTTEDLLPVIGVTRETLYEWAAKRLLPRPRVATGPDGRQYGVWSGDALERARYVVDRLNEGAAISEIAAEVVGHWPRRP